MDLEQFRGRKSQPTKIRSGAQITSFKNKRQLASNFWRTSYAFIPSHSSDMDIALNEKEIRERIHSNLRLKSKKITSTATTNITTECINYTKGNK